MRQAIDGRGELIAVGDIVLHRFRERTHQRGVIIEVEDGCNGGVRVQFDDEIYPSLLCDRDVAKIMEVQA